MDPFNPNFNPATQQQQVVYQPSKEEEDKARRFWIITNLMPHIIRANPEMSPLALASKARILADELLKDIA